MTVLLGVLIALLSLWVVTALVLAGYDLASYLHYRWIERSPRPVPTHPGRHRR